MHSSFVSPLEAVSGKDVSQVGGKGAHLGELIRAGFSVPPGFSVKSNAYERFLEASGLKGRIAEISAGIDFRDLEDVEAKTARIRETISRSAIPEEISAEIAEAYEGLSRDGRSPLVAVRSSVGTKDLRRSSFPGQMDTYHNVRGIEAVLAAVRECWASVWSARAAGTMHALGIDPGMIIIAPVVQCMVPSDVAGVLFTADPVRGDCGEMLLDAAFGLGEAVVSGRLTPDHYVISKEGLRVLTKNVGCKSFKLELDGEKGSGNRRVTLSDEEARRECLSPAQVKELAELGIAVEEHFGEPQDVEWAYAEGRLFVLQSRKIAGMASAVADTGPGEWASEFDTGIKEPPDTYTSANISEVFPGVLTPLTLDSVKMCDFAFWEINRAFGLLKEPFPEGKRDLVFIGLFYGRLHLNLSHFSRVLGKIPGASAAEFERSTPVDERGPEKGKRKVSLGAIPLLIRIAWNGFRLRRRAPKELDRLTSRLHRRIAENRGREFSEMSFEDFADLLELGSREGRELMKLHILNSQFATIFYGALRRLVRAWLGDRTEAFSARLVTGLATMESARPAFGIYRLYRYVAESDALTRLFREKEAAEILCALENGREAGVREFKNRLDGFLKEYGYRAVAEAELSALSWEEDPTFVLSMIRTYLGAGRVEDPADIEARQREDRQGATAEARARLGWFRRRIFKWVLKEACTFLAARENGKALVVRGLHEQKKMLRALGRKLCEKGILKDPDEIYFLTMEELIAWCRGGEIDGPTLVARRRAEHERNEFVRLPETFTGRPVPVGREGEVPRAKMLKGLPVSPGRVTGPARVIMDPRRDVRLEEGEILVAPVTDTGWTPLFILARGLVVDIGGLLSHGSIVAREYGIPGVLNVMVGTRLIKTGQIITVDGTRGEVYLHEE